MSRSASILDYGMPLNQLGYIYLKRKEFARALVYFERLTVARPDSANALDSLGYAYFRAGKVAEAKAAFLRILEKLPTMLPFDSLPYIHALEENYEEVLKLWDRILPLCKGREKHGVYSERAFYRGWVGDLDGSLSDLERDEEIVGALGIKTAVAQVMRLRAAVYLDQHKLELSRKAIEDYRAYYSENFPGKTAFHEALYQETVGRIECEEGNVDSADSRLHKMEALIPNASRDQQEPLRRRAGLLGGEVRLAQGLVGEVIRSSATTPLRPLTWDTSFNPPAYNSPFLRDVLARAYAKKGDLNKAIAEYERLTRFDPKRDAQFLIHPKYHYRLGLLFEQKGLKAKAAERYRRFLSCGRPPTRAFPKSWMPRSGWVPSRARAMSRDMFDFLDR